MALIDHTTRSATAKARTASKVAIVDQRRFLWLVQETPVFSRQVMGVMADRIRKLDKVLSSAWFPMTLVIESRYSPDA
jgi:CRP/FNR family cyclic AMP-dependent transcriptional regulator